MKDGSILTDGTPEEQKRLSEYLQEQEAESVFLLAGEA